MGRAAQVERSNTNNRFTQQTSRAGAALVQ
jgi:hypothetical protein